MTNTTAHTPGPWWVYNEGSRFPGVEAGLNGRNSSVVVYGNDNEIEGVKGRTHAEALANARLIAAAPALLEALEETVAADRHDPACASLSGFYVLQIMDKRKRRDIEERRRQLLQDAEPCDCYLSKATAAIAAAKGNKS